MILTQVVQSSIQPLLSCWKMLPGISLKTSCVSEGFWLTHLFCGQRAIKGKLAPSSPLLPPLSQYSSCEALFSVGSTGAERIWAIGYMAEKAISVGFIYADLIVSKTVVLQENTGSVNNCNFFSPTSVIPEERGSKSQTGENWGSWGQSGLQLSIMVNETMKVYNPGSKSIILIQEFCIREEKLCHILWVCVEY